MLNVQLHEIPGYDNFATLQPILEGGSGEDKYRVITKTGEQMFLRIGVCADSIQNHKKHILAETLDIPIARTIDFGVFGDNVHYYWLLTWLEGTSAFDLLPTLDDAGQFNLGVKSGTLLRKIHSLPITEPIEPLQEWLGRHIDFFTEEVRKKHGHNSKIHNNIIAYIHDNKDILRTRPQTFLHGDFGLSNLIVTPSGDIAPTDFSYNLRSYGYPPLEMSNFYETGATTPYTSGQVWGYFNGSIPKDFWHEYLFGEAYLALIIFATRKDESWTDYIENWYSERVANAVDVIPQWYVKK
ncbi:MAG: phosphotransferase [Firmicutes bacterium]|nr:phosphotransferase [Bacillota bacterium]